MNIVSMKVLKIKEKTIIISSDKKKERNNIDLEKVSKLHVRNF